MVIDLFNLEVLSNCIFEYNLFTPVWGCICFINVIIIIHTKNIFFLKIIIIIQFAHGFINLFVAIIFLIIVSNDAVLLITLFYIVIILFIFCIIICNLCYAFFLLLVFSSFSSGITFSSLSSSCTPPFMLSENISFASTCSSTFVEIRSFLLNRDIISHYIVCQ